MSRSTAKRAAKKQPAPKARQATAPPAGETAVSPRVRRVLWGLVAVYAAFFTTLSVIKYRFFLYDDIDLAIFTQAMHGLLRGSLDSSIRGVPWLGDHASLNLFLLLPVYAIFQHPLTLLVVQSAALALGAVAVFRIARREIGNDTAALALGAAYLAHPALAYLNLFEFHPEALSTAALLFAFDALRGGRRGRLLLFATLALLGKEDVAPVVAMMALFALGPRGNRRRFALPLAGLAVASLAVSFLVLKPLLGSAAASYGRMYAQWGDSPLAIVRNMITHPLAVIESLQATPGNAFDTMLKRTYYLHMLLPFAFLPLLSPRVLLIALPAWLAHFLSWRVEQHTIVFQYTALVLPFVVAAAAFGAHRVAHWLARGNAERRRRALAGLWALPVLGLACHLWFGPLVGPPWDKGRAWGQRALPSPGDRAMRDQRERMLARVPKQGGVVAGFELLDRFASRANVHPAHHVLSGRYTFSQEPFETPGGIRAVLVDFDRERLVPFIDEGTASRMHALFHKNDLLLTDAAGGLLLFVENPSTRLSVLRVLDSIPAAPDRIVYEGSLALLGSELDTARVQPGGTVTLFTTWERRRPVENLYAVELLLLDEERRPRLDVSRHLGYGLMPPSEWPLGSAMREEYRLILPDDLAPGTYPLGMRLFVRDGASMRPADTPDARVRASGMFVPLGSVDVGTD